MTRLTLGVLVCLALAVCGCSTVQGDYFWVDSLPPARAEEASCIIAEGDVLGVRVWGQEGLSVRTKVREDGMVTIPFVNDIAASGLEPKDLARRLQLRLKDFFVNPVVTVTLEEVRPIRVSVVGEVVKAGVYQFDQRGAGVLHALAAAGGMTPFADGDRIFVLRTNHWAEDPRRPARIRFTFQKLSRGDARAVSFALRSGDVVVVE